MSIDQQYPPQVKADPITELRRHGMYALAGLLAAVVLVVGYVVKRDFIDTPPPPLPPPLFDRYQLLENAHKQTIRLDKTDGSIAVIEDGVIVSETVDGRSSTRLRPHTFTWEKLNDGSKITAKLEYFNRLAYCSIKVENAPQQLRQRLAQPKPGDTLYKLQLGGGLLEAVFYTGLFNWTQAADGTLTLDQTDRLTCNAAMFQSIRTANIYSY